MDDFEDRLRSGLTRYAQTMRVTRPPLADLLDEPGRRLGPLNGGASSGRRLPPYRYVMASAGIAATAAAVFGVTQWRGAGSSDEDSVIASAGGCAPRNDGLVATGELSDGRPWEVSVEGEAPHLETSTRIDGSVFNSFRHEQDSWAWLVNQGGLTWRIDAIEQGRIVVGEVPPATASVDVRLTDGETVTLCPASTPGVDTVGLVAGYLPTAEIAEVSALDATGVRLAHAVGPGAGSSDDYASLAMPLELNPELVDLPLGGEAWPQVTPDELAEIASGQLSNGGWSLRVGSEDDLVGIALELPGVGTPVVLSGTAEEILADLSWHINMAGGQHFVSGVASGDVSRVVVTLGDGQTVDIPTIDPGVARFDGRLFAAPLPEGVSPTAMDGRAADGTVLVEAEDVAAGFERVDDPSTGWTLEVE